MTNRMKVLTLCALVSNLAWCESNSFVPEPGTNISRRGVAAPSSGGGYGISQWGGGFGGLGGYGGGPGGYGMSPWGGGFGGPGGYGGGFGGGGGGSGSGGSSSRSAAEEIGKLGEEASKEIKENQKQFLSSQEKSMQSFFNSLKETQVKEDSLKLLEDLNKDGSGVHGTDEQKSSISSIADKIIEDIGDNEQQRMKTFEAIGQMLIRPPSQPQSVRQTAAEKLTSFSGRASASPLGDLMGISAHSPGLSRPANPDYQEQGAEGVVDNSRGIRSKFLYNPPDVP